MFSNLRSLIFKFDPETAHNLAIKSLKFNFVPNVLDKDKENPLFKTKLFNKWSKDIFLFPLRGSAFLTLIKSLALFP